MPTNRIIRRRSGLLILLFLRLAALAAVCAVAASASAQQASLSLIHRPQLGPLVDTGPRSAGTGPLDVDAFPRLAGAGPSIDRINAALDRADARALKAAQQCVAASPGRSDWTRSIDVTMAGPRFVSFVAHDDMYCGGPHPDTATIVLVYDLTTGRPVDWTKLVPARLGGKPGTTTGGDGTVLGTLSSPMLKALYIREMKPDAGVQGHAGRHQLEFHVLARCQGQRTGHGPGRPASCRAGLRRIGDAVHEDAAGLGRRRRPDRRHRGRACPLCRIARRHLCQACKRQRHADDDRPRRPVGRP